MATLRDPWLATSTVTPEDLATLDASGMGSLRRGYESARLSGDANYNLAREATLRAAGEAAAADTLRGQTQALQRRASIYAPAVNQLEDINGIGDVPGYVAGQVGSGFGSMQDPLVAASAVNAVGTGLSLLPHPLAKGVGFGLRNIVAPGVAYGINQQQLKGEHYGNLSEDPTVMANFTPQEINDRANIYGAGAAVLDTAIPGIVGRQLGGAALLRKGAKPLMSPGLRLGGELLGEGVTEAGQELGSQYAHGLLNPDRDTSKDMSALANSFAGGVLGAGGPALAGHVADHGFQALGSVPGKVKDGVQGVVDLAKDTAAQVKDGTIDLKEQLKAASQDKKGLAEDDAAFMFGMPKDVDPNDAKAFGDWHKQNFQARVDRVNGELQELAAAGDDKAAEIAAGFQTPDPMAQEDAIQAGAAHIQERRGLQELADDAERGLAARGGAIAGKVMGGVLDAGKAAVGAAIGAVKKRKLNAQSPAWTGGEYEAQKQAAMNAYDEAGKVSEDKQRSYQRAELMGEIMAARAKTEVPRYTARRVDGSKIPDLMKNIGGEIASLAESWQHQAPKAMSQPGGPTSVLPKPGERNLQRFDALKLDLSRIARSMKAAYEDPNSVLEDLRKTADPSAAPFFDYLQSEMEAGPQQAAQTRQEARDALIKSIDEPTRTRLLQEGVDLQHPKAGDQLLQMVDAVSRGTAPPAARRELTKVLGRDNLERMLDVLYRQTPEGQAIEDAYARQTEKATTDSELQIDENGDVVDATEITDYDKRQAEKKVNAKPATRLYGFYGTPKPRTTQDPLAYDNEKVTKAAIKKWNQEAQALREMGQEPDYSTDPRQNDARRPRLFNLAQDGEHIAKRKLALEQQLKVDQTPARMLEMLRAEQAALRKKSDEESKIALSARTKAIQKIEAALGDTGNSNAQDWLNETTDAFFLNRAGSWRTEARSAWDMMTEADGIAEGAKPNPMFINKMLARYRDYMRQEAQRYEKSNPDRARSAREALNLTNAVLLDRVDQSSGTTPTRTTPKLRAKAWADAQEYFKSHGMVMAERAPTEDAQTLTADRVLQMADTGKKAASASRKKDENGNLIPPPDVLVFRSTLADSRTSKPGDLYITTRELMQFARDARFSTEGVDFENVDQHFSNKNKDTEHLNDLLDGITALVDSGLVEGLPKIFGQNGRPQYFSRNSVPGDLPLATKTYAGHKYAQQMRVKDPNRKDRTTDPTSDKYQDKVARDQNREFNTPNDAPDSDAPMRARIVMPGEGQFNADLFDKTRDPTRVKRMTTVDRLLNEEEDGLAEREAKRLEKVASRERDVVPSERERPNEGDVPDEYADQRRRSIIEGRTADGGAAAAKNFPKMKMADLGAKHGETLRKTFEASFEDGVAEAKTWLRQAAAPTYDAKGLTGGPHLAAPVVYALNGENTIGTTPAEKQEVRRLRVEAARILAASDMKPADKVRLARELATPEGRDRIVAANVQKFLERVVPEGPPIDTRSTRTEKATRAQNDVTSDEAVREYNDDTRSTYGSAADRTAPDKSLEEWNKERYFEQRSPAPSKDRARVEQAHSAAAPKEGAAPVGKISERPSGAAKRKLNSQATQLHNELGRMGFGAAHNSPIVHDGTFDWRKHLGKGEGNWVFGAGTYLSTGDGVHKFYKASFTKATFVDETLRDALQTAREEDPSASATDIRTGVRESLREGLIGDDGYSDAEIRNALRQLDKLSDRQLLGLPTPTYQVSVDIPSDRILNWNLPLNQQSKTIQLRALKAIKDNKIAVKTREAFSDDVYGDFAKESPLAVLTGEGLHRELAKALAPDKSFDDAAPKVSDYLQSLGILGHSYASNGGKDMANPNYVIYDDSKITTNFVAFNQQTPSSKVSTQAEMDEARAYINKVLPGIKVEFTKILDAVDPNIEYSGEWLEAQNTIQISTTPGPGTMQIAYHEALHAFFSKFVQANPQALETMKALTDDKKLLARVEALLAGHPNALADLADGEERLAYMYQFWAAGLLDLPTKKAGIFEAIKRFFHRVLGMVTDSERAVAILEAFHAGKMSDPSVAGQVIAEELAYGTLTTKAARKADRLVAKVQELTLPTQMVLANSDSAMARKLAPMFWTNPGDESHGDKGEGYINAKQAAATKYKNFLNEYIKDLSDRDLRDVASLMQAGKATDLNSIAYAPHREAVKNIDGLLKRFYRYMTEERGMQLGKINEGYFPRVWDVGTMLSKQPEFIDMLQTKYDHVLADGAKSSGLTKSEVAQRIFEKIVSSSLGEHILPQRSDGVLSPFFSSAMMRELSWLDSKDSEPFQNKDLIGTLTGYFHSGARAAEYTHRFGQDGEKLAADLKVIEKELKDAGKTKFQKGEFETQAEADKWAERRMEQVHKSVGAIEGTLGSDIGSTWRNTSAWITVYQNLRLLPLTLFASVVDPLGMVARGATMKQAYDTFLRGMREVFANWGDMLRKEPKERQADEWEKLAMAVGSVDAAMFSHHVADEYSSMYMSKKIARVNDAFFRLNGMEAWNRGVRVGATQAAVNFLQRHAKLPEAHSARWLKELGLTPADLTFDQDGQLVTDKNVLAAQKGIPKAQAEQEMERVHQAIRRWVQGAVLTPNAAQRPAWSSDPHYSMFFHLKQFSYSFQQTILKRAVNEMNYGNMAPMGAFMWYVPVMIASDITKGLLQGGGSLPSHMQGMSLGDWVMRGVNRSGLLGVGAIGVDAQQDLFSVAGPAVEQVIDSFGQPIGKTVVDALPGKPVFAEALR